MPTYLSNEEIGLILQAREKNNFDLCWVCVNRWIKARVRSSVSKREIREDIESDCMLFFIGKIFPKMEQRPIQATSVYLSKRIGMYIKQMCNKYKKQELDSEVMSRMNPSQDMDTTTESTDEIVQGGPAFTKVIHMLMEGKRQFEIAKELGISRQRVWQIKKKMQRVWRNKTEEPNDNV